MDLTEKIAEVETILAHLGAQIAETAKQHEALVFQKHFADGRLEALRELHTPPIIPPQPPVTDPA